MLGKTIREQSVSNSRKPEDKIIASKNCSNGHVVYRIETKGHDDDNEKKEKGKTFGDYYTTVTLLGKNKGKTVRVSDYLDKESAIKGQEEYEKYIFAGLDLQDIPFTTKNPEKGKMVDNLYTIRVYTGKEKEIKFRIPRNGKLLKKTGIQKIRKGDIEVINKKTGELKMIGISNSRGSTDDDLYPDGMRQSKGMSFIYKTQDGWMHARTEELVNAKGESLNKSVTRYYEGGGKNCTEENYKKFPVLAVNNLLTLRKEQEKAWAKGENTDQLDKKANLLQGWDQNSKEAQRRREEAVKDRIKEKRSKINIKEKIIHKVRFLSISHTYHKNTDHDMGVPRL